MANVSSSNGLEKCPKLRFPGFDEPWKAIHLSDVGGASSGFGFPDAYQGEETSEIPFYKVSDMNLPKNTKVMQQSNNYVSQLTAKKLRVRPFSEDAIVFAKVGAAISHERKRIALSPFLIDNNMMAFTPKRKGDLEFIYHLFQKIKLSKYSQVGALPSYNANDILDIRTFYPTSGNERKKIVTILSLIDNRIEKQSEIITNLKKYKRGLQNRFFFKRSHLSPKASEIDSHDVEPLGSVVHINPKTGSLPEAFIYIDLECVESGVLNSKKLISRNSAPSRAQRLLEEGDLLYQMVRPYQKNNYYFQKAFEYPTVASTGYAQIRCSKMDTQFIFEQLSSDYFAREAMLRSTGTGYPAINADDLAEIPIWVPPLNQQEKIGAALSSLGEKIEVHQKLLSALCSVKSSLMQQLFI